LGRPWLDGVTVDLAHVCPDDPDFPLDVRDGDGSAIGSTSACDTAEAEEKDSRLVVRLEALAL